MPTLAQFVIESNRIFLLKTAILPHGHGEFETESVLNLFRKIHQFQKYFVKFGYADELGSGMRNTNKYTKLYSGGTPVFFGG